jgi:hypothetical protein
LPTAPEGIDEAAATTEGNAILGHVLGGRDASRSVAEQAAQTTGVDSSIVKQLLPLVATLANHLLHICCINPAIACKLGD